MNGLTYTVEHWNGNNTDVWKFTVQYAEYNAEQERHAFDWTITRNNTVLSSSYGKWNQDAKIRTGCRGCNEHPGSLSEVLVTLFSFLSAWLEAIDYGDEGSENTDLFDASRLGALLDAFSSDELALFGNEIIDNY